MLNTLIDVATWKKYSNILNIEIKGKSIDLCQLRFYFILAMKIIPTFSAYYLHNKTLYSIDQFI